VAQERKIDLATQAFLCEADRQRVDLLSLPSFRSKVGQGARDGPEDPEGEELQRLIEDLDEEERWEREEKSGEES
jgi:hypothetical protein